MNDFGISEMLEMQKTLQYTPLARSEESYYAACKASMIYEPDGIW